MRRALVAGWLLLCPVAPAMAYVDVNIGINLGGYPALQPIPGYPVYYAPDVNANYFFYDGLYWVFDGNDWFASSWYNGPWQRVDRFEVPVYLLRVPVRYYRHAPDYFRQWRADGPPRWDARWGREWSDRHRGWDRWDRRNTPRPAPLPTYQRDYRGDRYPGPVQQREMQSRNYGHRPSDPNVARFYESRGGRDIVTPREAAAIEQSRSEQRERQMNPQERINRDRDRQGGGG
ncbi:MAG TPA: hypothetical protein VFP44_18465 [Usitatibacter sp.]|nr:hypothetical protein [Usitatibacter sp.]